MPNLRYRQGANFERTVKAKLEKENWFVLRSAGLTNVKLNALIGVCQDILSGNAIFAVNFMKGKVSSFVLIIVGLLINACSVRYYFLGRIIRIIKEGRAGRFAKLVAKHLIIIHVQLLVNSVVKIVNDLALEWQRLGVIMVIKLGLYFKNCLMINSLNYGRVLKLAKFGHYHKPLGLTAIAVSHRSDFESLLEGRTTKRKPESWKRGIK